MTQESLEKAVSIQDDLDAYRKIRNIAERPLVYLNYDTGMAYKKPLPKDLLLCISKFCDDRIENLEKEFAEL